MMNDRTGQVLYTIVQSFIETHEPVGSRFLVKRYNFNFSPATIRNIMADLEELGFLSQPHTSAGRVPTDRGYRFYVDRIRQMHEEGEKLTSMLAGLESVRDDIDSLLEGAARTLSENSSYLGVAAPAKPGRTTLNRIELFGYKGRHIAVVLITNEGVIKHKLIRTEWEITPNNLRRISEYLNSEFSGYAIDEIRLKIIKEMSREKAMCDILISKAMEICREALNFPLGDIYMHGLAEFIGIPDFSYRIKDIARAIEDKGMVLKLLEKVCQESEDGTAVLIGSENPVKEMRDLGMVVAYYTQDGKQAGTVGIIGPIRMDYAKTIRLVETTARFISDALTDKRSSI